MVQRIGTSCSGLGKLKRVIKMGRIQRSKREINSPDWNSTHQAG